MSVTVRSSIQQEKTKLSRPLPNLVFSCYVIRVGIANPYLLVLRLLIRFLMVQYSTRYWSYLNDVSAISQVKYEQMGQVFRDTKVLFASLLLMDWAASHVFSFFS
jgi:hypothetical protein